MLNVKKINMMSSFQNGGKNLFLKFCQLWHVIGPQDFIFTKKTEFISFSILLSKSFLLQTGLLFKVI